MRGEWKWARPRAARKLVPVLMLVLSAGACTPLDDGLAAVFGRSMRDQPSFSPYENPRLPAEGSMPFAAGNYPAVAGGLNMGQSEPMEYDLPPFTQLELFTVAAEMENPIPATPASLERGKAMYERYCVVCHGAQGIGAEAPIIEKHPVLAVFNVATGGSVGQSDGYIYGIIRVGRGIMPPYGHQVPHFDRWHLVNYVRQLQAGAN